MNRLEQDLIGREESDLSEGVSFYLEQIESNLEALRNYIGRNRLELLEQSANDLREYEPIGEDIDITIKVVGDKIKRKYKNKITFEEVLLTEESLRHHLRSLKSSDYDITELLREAYILKEECYKINKISRK